MSKAPDMSPARQKHLKGMCPRLPEAHVESVPRLDFSMSAEAAAEMEAFGEAMCRNSRLPPKVLLGVLYHAQKAASHSTFPNQALQGVRDLLWNLVHGLRIPSYHPQAEEEWSKRGMPEDTHWVDMREADRKFDKAHRKLTRAQANIFNGYRRWQWRRASDVRKILELWGLGPPSGDSEI